MISHSSKQMEALSVTKCKTGRNYLHRWRKKLEKKEIFNTKKIKSVL